MKSVVKLSYIMSDLRVFLTADNICGKGKVFDGKTAVLVFTNSSIRPRITFERVYPITSNI